MFGWVEAKLLAGPIVVAAWVFAQLPEAFRMFLDVAALGALLAGGLVVGKLRSSADAAERAAEAWRSEAGAVRTKADRLDGELRDAEQKITELKVLVSTLEARPTLESIEAEIVKLQRIVQSAVALPPSSG